MKICLAASGGGHLRQVAQLLPLLAPYEIFLVTQKTPLGLSLSKEVPTRFLPDVAFANLKRSPRQWRSFLRNLLDSLRILREEKPDLVISTGAGLAFNLLWLSKWFPARTVFIESIAHVYTPTTTGRLLMNRVDAYLVQWEDLHRRYPGSVLACPVRISPPRETEGDKQGTFVTVGTHGPFPRLIQEIERLAALGKLEHPLRIQHPSALDCPHADSVFETCSPETFEKYLRESRLVITHAGSGSIFSALKARCRVIALARLARYGEHYDDHQLELLEKMVETGAILGSEKAEDLERLVEEAKSFPVPEVVYDPTVIMEGIDPLLAEWFPGQGDG